MLSPRQIGCLMLINHGLVRKTAKVRRIFWARKFGYVENKKRTNL